MHLFIKIHLIRFWFGSLKVCDLYCGGGFDAEKWDEALIGHYIGIGIKLCAFCHNLLTWVFFCFSFGSFCGSFSMR